MDNLSAMNSNRSFMDLEASVYSADDLAALVEIWWSCWGKMRYSAPLSLTGAPTTGPSDSIH